MCLIPPDHLLAPLQLADALDFRPDGTPCGVTVGDRKCRHLAFVMQADGCEHEHIHRHALCWCCLAALHGPARCGECGFPSSVISIEPLALGRDEEMVGMVG